MNMGGNLGGALSPTLTPFLAERFGRESALSMAAALAVIGALFWLGIHPERAIDLGEISKSENVSPSLSPRITVGTESCK
jgi:dipeptide/tripeptide permease